MEQLLAIDDIEISNKSQTSCFICLDMESNGLISLQCGHSVHYECISEQLRNRWPGKRVNFGYLKCGICRLNLAHDSLMDAIDSHQEIKSKVESLCITRFMEDNLDERNVENIDKEYCLNIMSCYICEKCENLFCGGLVSCANAEVVDASTLLCQPCHFSDQSVPNEPVKTENEVWMRKCEIHGFKYAIYKCDSCCSIATFDCSSNHYCDRCHNQASTPKNYLCPGKELCPLGIDHPPNKSGVHGTIDTGNCQ